MGQLDSMGEEMKHFSTEEWIDFVNNVATRTNRASMQRHLEQGCKRCTQTVSLWRHVRESAAAEAKYQPPAESVRVAKSAFSAAALAGAIHKKHAGIVEVLFDSLLQPMFQGARSVVSPGTRQMLYRCGPFQIDIQIEAKPGGNQVVVTGQLLNANHPDVAERDISVTISNLRGHVVHMVTNQFGEFRAETEHNGDLELTFAPLGGEPIVISLREALNRLPWSGQ